MTQIFNFDFQKSVKFFFVSFALLCISNSKALEVHSPTVVVSFSVLEDITRNLVPSDFKIQTIVKAGMDSHGYEPMALDYLKFKKADLIILSGNHFEPWADRALAKIKSKAKVYFVTNGIDLLPLKDDDHHHEEKQSVSLDQHPTFDPHFWQSPAVTKQVVEKLSEYLQKTFPANQAAIKAKTAAYLIEISRLQTRYKSEFAGLPEQRKTIVIAHNSFQYFSKEFGIKVDSLLDASQEGESSIKRVAALIKKIKNEKIQNLFFEKSSPEGLMKSLSKESGVEIAGTLYSDCLSTNNEASTYLKMLDYNFGLILKSMKGSKP